MFYIIEYTYIGDNQEHNIDANRVEISSQSASTLIGEESEDGFDDTWGSWGNADWQVEAYGAHETLEGAREALHVNFWQLRPVDEKDDLVALQFHVVEAYRFGQYKPLNAVDTYTHVYNELLSDITTETTPERIILIAHELEAEANSNGLALDHRAIVSCAEDIRAELVQEQNDEA